MKSEFALIEDLKRRLRVKPGVIGVGDDAAVLPPVSPRMICTTDAIVDGVDFYLKKLAPEKIGRKAMAVNLSDAAAMGAEPGAFVVALGIPADLSAAWLRRFYNGLLGLAGRHGAYCVGGDLSRARQFFCCLTLWGRASKPVLRRGARPGDWIGVTGTLGGSITRHHYAFEPRVREGQLLARLGVKAMIDLSDGLAQDLGHVLKASRVSAFLDLDRIPVSREALRLERGNSRRALERALADGEDFELLFTAGSAARRAIERQWKKAFPRTPLAWIGRIQKRKGREVLEWHEDGKAIPSFKLKKEGFRHF